VGVRLEYPVRSEMLLAQEPEHAIRGGSRSSRSRRVEIQDRIDDGGAAADAVVRDMRERGCRGVVEAFDSRRHGSSSCRHD
jgi:hypothetical protein